MEISIIIILNMVVGLLAFHGNTNFRVLVETLIRQMFQVDPAETQLQCHHDLDGIVL